MCVVPLSIAATTAPAAELRTDVEYSRPKGVPLTLDASIPDGTGPFAAAIVVHGGGFTKGAKQGYEKPILAPLTDAHISWFTINYRLAPEYKYPAPIEDIYAAIRFVKAHAAEYKVDPRRIALIGESAGAFHVDAAAIDAPKDARVAAVVSFYGPADLVMQGVTMHGGKPGDGITALTGIADLDPAGRSQLHDISPINKVRAKLPPFLLIHGSIDEQVPFEQSVKFRRALLDKGNKCELYEVEGGKHGVGSWEKDPALQGYKTKMTDWLRETLK